MKPFFSTLVSFSMFVLGLLVATIYWTWPEPEPFTLTDALNKAESEGKFVLVHVSGPSWGLCPILKEFLEYDEIINDHFVVFEHLVKPAETPTEAKIQAEKLAMGLGKPEDSGLPWMSIVKPDRIVVADSGGPSGNIGLPSKEEGIQHFREMFAATELLTSDELDQVIKNYRTFLKERPWEKWGTE